MAAVLADPAVPEPVKGKLRLAGEARAFAFDAMGLPRSASFTRYAAIQRPYVTLIVTACRKTRLAPYTWWFPVVGRVPYKGYFDEARARREAERLARRGYDTDLEEVTAYSSLGWRADPLVSPMLDGSPGRLAETVIHELSHAAFWFKDSADFDESAADFLGEEGARAFLAGRFGADSEEARGFEEEVRRQQAFDVEVDGFYAELARLYASDATEADKLGRREEIFARAEAALGLKAVNNAVVLDDRRYRGDRELLRRAFARRGGDWRRFLDLIRSLDERRPREALQAFLAGGR